MNAVGVGIGKCANATMVGMSVSINIGRKWDLNSWFVVKIVLKHSAIMTRMNYCVGKQQWNNWNKLQRIVKMSWLDGKLILIGCIRNFEFWNSRMLGCHDSETE